MSLAARPPASAVLILTLATLAVGPAPLTAARAPERRVAADGLARVDANQINMVVTNQNSFALDLPTNNAGLIWPRGSTKTAVFAGGLWLAAKVNDSLRVAVADYSFEFRPGPAPGGIPASPYDPVQRVYKVVPWTGSASDTAHLNRSAAELAADPHLDPLAHDSWSEYLSGAAPYGAPTRTWRLPKAPGDSIDVPGPDVTGSQMLWSVFNDLDSTAHNNHGGGTVPLGVEVRQTTFAFAQPESLANTVFLRYRVLNRSANPLDSMFVSLWSDPDLGNGSDDLAGCDTTRALGFCYNGQPTDAVYGARPPAVGYALLQGPVDPVSGDTLGLAAFRSYIGGLDPSSPQETWWYMRGLGLLGGPMVNPTTGAPTAYTYSGDPVAGTGWLDQTPTDKRVILTSGPFRLAPGDSTDMLYAVLVGGGADAIASVDVARRLTDQARAVWRGGFPVVPPGEPVISSLLLFGARPNPAIGRLTLAFSLASSEPARLELHDIAGRRVLAQDLGAVSAGPQQFDLGESARFRPGIYFARLTQGGRHVTRTVVILR